MSGGIDKIFPEPPHEIRGATPADQGWIDETVEAGKSCCGWEIKPRPLGLDANRRAKPPVAALKPAAAKPKRRLRDRILHPLSSGLEPPGRLARYGA